MLARPQRGQPATRAAQTPKTACVISPPADIVSGNRRETPPLMAPAYRMWRRPSPYSHKGEIIRANERTRGLPEFEAVMVSENSCMIRYIRFALDGISKHVLFLAFMYLYCSMISLLATMTVVASKPEEAPSRHTWYVGDPTFLTTQTSLIFCYAIAVGVYTMIYAI